MKQLITVVSHGRHSNKFWQPAKSFHFTAESQFAIIAGGELPEAVCQLPLCFVLLDGRFRLTALLSPEVGNNYFVGKDGRWLAGYVPMCFRGYPFKLGHLKDKERVVLCVDENSGLISESEGEAFFGPDGQISPPLTKILALLQKVEQNNMLTQKAVDSLAEAGLFIEWPLRIKTGQKEFEMPGLYRVDEGRLGNLSDEGFLRLRAVAALPIAYGQLFSMGNIGILGRLSQIREKQQPAVPNEADIDKLFGEDGMLRFDEG